MKRIVADIALTLAIIYLVPFVVYGLFSAAGLIAVPEGSPAVFLLGVLVDKIGVAVAFVLIYRLARQGFAGRWLLYAFIWWLMFVFGELGRAPAPTTPGWKPWRGSSPRRSTFPWLRGVWGISTLDKYTRSQISLAPQPFSYLSYSSS